MATLILPRARPHDHGLNEAIVPIGIVICGAPTLRRNVSSSKPDAIGDGVAVLQPPGELVGAVGIRADRHRPAAQLAEPGHDRGCRERLGDRIAEAAGVDLERRAAVDQGAKDGLVQLGRGRELGRGDVRVEVALDAVDVADGIEQPGSRGGLDLVEVRRDDLGQRPAGDPAPRRSSGGTATSTRSWTEPIVKSYGWRGRCSRMSDSQARS